MLPVLIALLCATCVSEYVPHISSVVIAQQIATSFSALLWNQFSPSIAESRTKIFRMNRSSKSVARDRSL